MEQAQGEVEQIRELIDDVLFLSELETGREVVTLGYTPALPILREIVDENAERAQRAGISLALEGDARIELPLRPRMLRVVAGNLLQNAVRYAGPGASFTFSVRHEDGGAILEAADTGIGVSEHDLPRLFERFYRTDRARASRGTGLGLAIVKHVVTAAGGSVDAEGARGAGPDDSLSPPARLTAHRRRPDGAVTTSSQDVHRPASHGPNARSGESPAGTQLDWRGRRRMRARRRYSFALLALAVALLAVLAAGCGGDDESGGAGGAGRACRSRAARGAARRAPAPPSRRLRQTAASSGRHRGGRLLAPSARSSRPQPSSSRRRTPT